MYVDRVRKYDLNLIEHCYFLRQRGFVKACDRTEAHARFVTRAIPWKKSHRPTLFQRTKRFPVVPSHIFVYFSPWQLEKMHSNPFVVPSAPAKNYYYRVEDYPRIEVGAKHFRRFNEMSRQRILNPHENDVLMGRGGKNNQHSGNERLRQIARLHCEGYRSSSKKEKSNLSRHLVREMRSLNPPARYVQATLQLSEGIRLSMTLLTSFF